MIEYTWWELTRLKTACNGYTWVMTIESNKLIRIIVKKFIPFRAKKTYPIKDRLKSYCSGASLFCQEIF